jgi:hypothetical protein
MRAPAACAAVEGGPWRSQETQDPSPLTYDVEGNAIPGAITGKIVATRITLETRGAGTWKRMAAAELGLESGL